MKSSKTIFLSLILLTVFMAACAPMKDAINPYEENFKCRAKDDEGQCIDTPTAYRKARYPQMKEGFDPDKFKNEAQDNRYKIIIGLLKEEKKPILRAPKILRVLLLPYEGEEKELFMTRYAYLKIEDSKWILTDLAEK